MQEEEVFATKQVFQKYQNMKPSGYIDEQYQKTYNYPQIDQYHFRIEDDKQIIELQNLIKKSDTIHTGINIPSSASMDYTQKLDNLISCLEQVKLNKMQDNFVPERHGFYDLGQDSYNQQQALKEANESLRLQNLNKEMQKLQIQKKNINLKRKGKKNNNEMKEQQKLVNKIKNLSIDEQYL